VCGVFVKIKTPFVVSGHFVLSSLLRVPTPDRPSQWSFRHWQGHDFRRSHHSWSVVNIPSLAVVTIRGQWSTFLHLQLSPFVVSGQHSFTSDTQATHGLVFATTSFGQFSPVTRLFMQF